jgi:hypothetical protein
VGKSYHGWGTETRGDDAAGIRAVCGLRFLNTEVRLA